MRIPTKSYVEWDKRSRELATDGNEITEYRRLRDLMAREEKEVERLETLIEKPMKDEGRIRRVEIIVLKYKSPDIEAKCVADIIRNTSHPYKLTLYDNRKNTANTSKIWNKLIRESTCPYVCVMDSDAFVTRDWLKAIMEVFKRNKKAGIVSPVAGENSNVTTWQKRDKETNEPRAIRLDCHVSGYCYVAKRELFDKVGWFDEDFYVFGQESDLIERIYESGTYEIWGATGSQVTHGTGGQGGSMSTEKAYKNGEFDWRVDTERAQYLFERNKTLRNAGNARG